VAKPQAARPGASSPHPVSAHMVCTACPQPFSLFRGVLLLTTLVVLCTAVLYFLSQQRRYLVSCGFLLFTAHAIHIGSPLGHATCPLLKKEDGHTELHLLPLAVFSGEPFLVLMLVHLCACVCACVTTCAHVCICMRACASLCTCVYARVCICVYMCACLCVHICVCSCVHLCVHVCVSVLHICVCACVHLCVHVCVSVCTSVYARVCICVYMCACL
jgi:hypothetical protein